MNTLARIAVVGAGATALIDAWAVLRRRALGVPLPDYGFVGRWLGHMAHGQFRHDAIAAAPPIPGERGIGWIAHYLTGIAYAALLAGIAGSAWFLRPTPGIAFAIGMGTVAAPFFLMQPGMGAGIAASRMPDPAHARLHSLAMHAVFGLGLYLSARALASLT